MNKNIPFLAMGAFVALAGCSPKTAEAIAETPAVAAHAVASRPLAALPVQRIYKMSGDYANLVPVTLDANGNLASYPGPRDLSETQKPLALIDGWYLDRRGIAANTAFLDYTYEEYMALDKVPSNAELMAHIKVRDGITALWDCGRTRRSPEECIQLIRNGFLGCKPIVAPCSE